MSEVAKAIDLESLQRELEDATTELESARLQEDRARKAACGAMNRLNAAHKALDDAIASLRSAAPRGSDWRNADFRLEGEGPT